MRVLQVNSGDVVGSRFNGFAARNEFKAAGVDFPYLVWTRTSSDPSVRKIFNYPGSRIAMRALSLIERKLAVHSLLQLHSFALPLHRDFRTADVVHYHIIHDGYFSILALPWLSRLKPTVWTWHDPWIMTGHCVYSMGCDRWQLGCGFCPNLALPFALEKDRTGFLFRRKQWVCDHSDVDVVVASTHMLDMARRSPIARTARLHHIPFGIDLDRFQPRDAQPFRNKFGIYEDRVVLFVRAFDSPFKGFEHFVQSMRRLPSDMPPLTIITTHQHGLLNEFIGRHQIIELGWVNDEDLILDAYTAADLFVMPSTAEAFGMMAIEAMACGKPVIVFDGTSLPEVTFAPEAGLAVPMGATEELAQAIVALVRSPGERKIRGERGRRLAEQHYDVRLHVSRMASLYQEVAERPRGQDMSPHEAIAADRHSTL